jgi:hypothetical protein
MSGIIDGGAVAEQFVQTGGARIGNSRWFGLNVTWPFAKLEFDDSELTLSCLGKRFIFRKEDVSKLSKYAGIFSAGLRIEHTIEKYKPFIVFWTFDFGRLQEELNMRGWMMFDC